MRRLGLCLPHDDRKDASKASVCQAVAAASCSLTDHLATPSSSDSRSRGRPWHLVIYRSPFAFFVSLLTCSLKACSVDGVEIHGMVQYLVGQPHVQGSIYTECINNIATCYMDNGLLDAPHPEIPCSDVTVEKHSRQLGMLAAAQPWLQRVVCLNWTESFSSASKELFKRAFKEYREEANITFINVNQCRETYGKKTLVCYDCQRAVSVTRSKPWCYATAGSSEKLMPSDVTAINKLYKFAKVYPNSARVTTKLSLP